MCKSSSDLVSRLEELQAEIKALQERLAALETPPAAPTPNTPAKTSDAAPVNGAASKVEPISEETLLVISAAVAAFLGERYHIRQIRLVTSFAWAVQGRVSIQASHQLHR